MLTNGRLRQASHALYGPVLINGIRPDGRLDCNICRPVELDATCRLHGNACVSIEPSSLTIDDKLLMPDMLMGLRKIGWPQEAAPAPAPAAPVADPLSLKL